MRIIIREGEGKSNGVIPAEAQRRAGIQKSGKEMDTQYFVYILASKRNGTLYVGVTSALAKRIWEHKNGAVEGFTKEHGVKTLVYYEGHKDVEQAIRREKRLKRWDRRWKLELIEKDNPEWRDLYDEICN
jgi:putative endonuclease